MMHTLKIRQQAGLSLIELMVAITLSMILMLGAIQIFLSSKNSYISNQQLSEIQENGRFALDILARDIRNAGYRGQCIATPRNHIASSIDALWSLTEGPVFGWKDGSPPSFMPASVNSGGIFVQFASGGQADFEGSSTNTAANKRIDWSGTSMSSPLKEGDTAIISDGLGCDIFSSATNNSGYIEKDDSKSRAWSHEYTDEFEVLKLHGIAYYIANDQGSPALFRTAFDYSLNPIANETYAIVSGIESLQIEYGVGRGVDLNRGVVTEYMQPESITNWNSVFSVKITLTAKAQSGMEKPFSTTIGLRNQLP